MPNFQLIKANMQSSVFFSICRDLRVLLEPNYRLHGERVVYLDPQKWLSNIWTIPYTPCIMVQYVLITTFRLCSICERGCCLFHCLYQPGKNVLQRKWEKTGGNVLQWKWEKKAGGNVLQWKWKENRWKCFTMKMGKKTGGNVYYENGLFEQDRECCVGELDIAVRNCSSWVAYRSTPILIQHK